MRLIDADKLKIEMMKAFDCEDATKYGNKNAEQQAHSYSTLMLYEISNVVEDCIDNAPTVVAENATSERPQGKWLPRTSYDGFTYWRCDNCRVDVDEKTDYCPHCGAKMGKE